MEKVAVVTGSNRGIGYGIVKGLVQKFDGVVYLTARNEKRGLDALQSLKDVCKDPEKLRFHKLDILDQNSIQTFHDHIKTEHQGLDILVNNAAIAFKKNATEPFGYQAEQTLQTNYFALVTLCQMLFPLLRPHARVVNLSSSAGHLSNVVKDELKMKLLDETMTEEQLSTMMREYIELAKEGRHMEAGWPLTAYSASKIAVTKLSFIQHIQLSDEIYRPDMVANAVHPGSVDTEMTSHQGPWTIDQGARAPVYAALLPPNVREPRGQFIWHDTTIVNWDGEIPHPIKLK